MPELKTYDLFISHSWSYGDAYEKLCGFFDKIATTLAKGDRVEIRGLCSFYVKKYKAYAGRNPKTGEPVRVNGKKLPFFKCGMELRNRVDY
jgi:integration host factor subunit beta